MFVGKVKITPFNGSIFYGSRPFLCGTTFCFVSLLSYVVAMPADAWFVYTMFPLIRTWENVADVDCLRKRFLSLMSRHLCTMTYYSTDLSRHLLTSSDIFWHLFETSVEIPHSSISSPVLSLGISVSKMSEDVGRCQKMSEDGSSSAYYFFCGIDEFCPFLFYDLAFKEGSSSAGTTCCSKQITVTYYCLDTCVSLSSKPCVHHLRSAGMVVCRILYDILWSFRFPQPR